MLAIQLLSLWLASASLTGASLAQAPLFLSADSFCLVRQPLTCAVHKSLEPPVVCSFPGPHSVYLPKKVETPAPSKESGLSPPPPSKWENTGKCVDKYCVYRNLGFANRRGIVAVTTQKHINRIQALEKKASSSQKENFHQNSAWFNLSEVSGKGLGLVTNTSLSRGNILMALPPALIIHQRCFEQTPHASLLPLLEAAVASMPVELEGLFMGQMSHFPGPKIPSILATNIFQMDLGGYGGDGGHYGNFPEISRFNHDCRPNVIFHIDPVRLVAVTTIVREVIPGEELSISYVDPKDPKTKRQERIKEAWGFECSCSLCTAPPKEEEKSRKRVEGIKELERTLEDLGAAKGKVNKKMMERLVKRYREERLEGYMSGGLTLVAMNFNMLGDAKNAEKYAKMAEEAVVMERGRGAADAEAMRNLGRDPRGHFTWRARVGR
ncbi:hypothetical protein QBC35DRAFT_546637 [Podospora australis]|uniref:SET domain-containing protein n=1 Tax=Podospora australis TaxID=1536484 RepID=A0AAN6WJL3_9PEZI|nr:hypothetical protein QBC35DRAFT_546637 [Podospora australis]